MCYLYVVDDYLVIKGKEILLKVILGMKFEVIVFGDKSYLKKSIIILYLYEVLG